MNNFRKALPFAALVLVAVLAYRDFRHQQKHLPVVWAQANNTTYDCLVSGTVTAATRSTVYQNSFTGGQSMCSSWRIEYYTDGISGVSLQFEIADQLASGAVGTWTAVGNNICSSSQQPPCVLDGSNPITTLGYGTFAISAYAPYFSLNVTTFTGSGHIQYRIYGYKGLSAKSRVGGSGGNEVLTGTLTTGQGSGTAGSITLNGSTSGSATIQAAATQGTPNAVQLPTTTGTTGQLLSTDGGTPQQLSWVSAGTPTIRAVSVSTTTPATIGATAFGYLTFDTTVSDSSGGAFHSTVTNTDRFTADSNGWYRLTCSVLQGTYNGNAALGITKNNVAAGAAFGILAYVDTSTSGTQSKAWTTGAEYQLVTNDYLRCSWLNGQGIPNNNHTDWAVFTKLGN